MTHRHPTIRQLLDESSSIVTWDDRLQRQSSSNKLAAFLGLIVGELAQRGHADDVLDLKPVDGVLVHAERLYRGLPPVAQEAIALAVREREETALNRETVLARGIELGYLASLLPNGEPSLVENILWAIQEGDPS